MSTQEFERPTKNVTHGHARRGLKSRAYRSWNYMLQRCYNAKNTKFPLYGGRGISVCERWHHFPNFLEDMGECPEGLSLDRKDSNGNYEPNNCRWATPIEQSNNIRTNRFLEFNGSRKTMAQWAREIGCSAATLTNRLKRGWSLEKTLTTAGANRG